MATRTVLGRLLSSPAGLSFLERALAGESGLEAAFANVRVEPAKTQYLASSERASVDRREAHTRRIFAVRHQEAPGGWDRVGLSG